MFVIRTLHKLYTESKLQISLKPYQGDHVCVGDWIFSSFFLFSFFFSFFFFILFVCSCLCLYILDVTVCFRLCFCSLLPCFVLTCWLTIMLILHNVVVTLLSFLPILKVFCYFMLVSPEIVVVIVVLLLLILETGL